MFRKQRDDAYKVVRRNIPNLAILYVIYFYFLFKTN